MGHWVFTPSRHPATFGCIAPLRRLTCIKNGCVPDNLHVASWCSCAFCGVLSLQKTIGCYPNSFGSGGSLVSIPRWHTDRNFQNVHNVLVAPETTVFERSSSSQVDWWWSRQIWRVQKVIVAISTFFSLAPPRKTIGGGPPPNSWGPNSSGTPPPNTPPIF